MTLLRSVANRYMIPSTSLAASRRWCGLPAPYLAAGVAGIGRGAFFAVFAAGTAAHRSIKIGQDGIAVINVRSGESADFSAAAGRADRFLSGGRLIRLPGSKCYTAGIHRYSFEARCSICGSF